MLRRVRDKRGLLQLSKRAKAFHPGQGVYRSSYKNARRLTATENNIAYRTADYLRYQQMDFVVGIQICLSNNHTVLLQPGETTSDKTQLRADGTPKANAVRHLVDICDELQGRYPKDFKFTGWHPHCRCHVITILKTEEEMKQDTQRILRGEDPTPDSVNSVDELPPNFTEWVQKRKGKLTNATNPPYFIKDNRAAVNGILGIGNTSAVTTWRNDELFSDGKPHYGAALKLGREAKNEANRVIGNISAPELAAEQKRNIEELADALGYSRKKIKPMNYIDANNGACNPDRNSYNCQSVVVAFEARRRGIDCYALPYDGSTGSVSKRLGDAFQEAWLSAKNGQPIQPTIIRGESNEEIIAKFYKQTKAKGRYVLGVNYYDEYGKETGHLLFADKTDTDELIIHDEQNNTYTTLKDWERLTYLEVIKVDKTLLNVKLIRAILGTK